MNTADLVARFAELPKGAGREEFKAIALSENRRDFLAKAEDGAPVFLLHDSSTAKYVPEINLRHLSAPFHVLKQQAKQIKVKDGISRAEALNAVARREGYNSWSLLASRYKARAHRSLPDRAARCRL